MGRTACTEPQWLYKGDLYHLFKYCKIYVLSAWYCVCDVIPCRFVAVCRMLREFYSLFYQDKSYELSG
jgi:hypothetical protein